VGAVGLGCTAALAGHFHCDFNTNPADILTIIGTGEWRPDDGATGATGDGYLAVTDAINSLASKIVFDDFDTGMVVKSFTYTCDLRIGNANGCDGHGADGFSVSYCRGNDLVMSDTYLNTAGAGWSGTVNEPGVPDASGLPEEGTETGVSVGFDTWDSGSALWPADLNGSLNDIEGISIRVDNKVVTQVSLPTRNGVCTDITSLQTGPYDTANPGSPAGLCWQPFSIELAEDGKLTVTWKGNKVLDAYQTAYSAGPGRLVFGGRTGGCNQNIHVDNIDIVTVPSDKIVIGQATGTPVGFEITASDSGPAVSDTNTIQLTLDGAAVTLSEVLKSGATTTVRYWDVTKPLVIGSAHTVNLSIKDTRQFAVSADRLFTVPSYLTLPPAYAASGVDLSKPGFKVRAHFNPNSETFDAGVTYVTRAGYEMENTVARAEEQLFGLRGPNKLAASDYVEENVINYSFDVNADLVTPAPYGSFRADPADPLEQPRGPNDWPDFAPWGIEGAYDTSNIAAEIETYVSFPETGVYVLIFNSDDGFRTTCDPQVGELLTSLIVSEADVGKGSSDIAITLYVPQPGIYPMRTVWFQGGGGANLEWSGMEQVPKHTARALLNADVAKAPTALRTYRETTGTVPAGITFIDPARNSGNPYPPEVVLRAEITDGSAGPVDQGSIVMQLDGAAVTPDKSNSGGKTELTYTPPTFLTSGSTHTVIVSFSAPGGQSYSGTNTFTVLSYTTIPPSMALPAAAVDKGQIGFLLKTFQVGILQSNYDPAATNPENGLDTSTYGGETEIHGLYGWTNLADLTMFTGPAGYYQETLVINYNGQSDNDGHFADTGPNMPGIPGTALNESGSANYAVEMLTVLDFTKAGLYAMVFNSDDGFRTTVGNPNEANRRGRPLVLGEYDGGRGSSDTIFYFRVLTPGLYPFRTLYWEGGGDDSCEWSMYNMATHQYVLINDLADHPADALKAYQYPILTTKGSPYVKYFTPVRNTAYFNSNIGAGARTGTDAGIKAVLVDGETAVDPLTVKLTLDSVDVTTTTTVNKVGTETTVSYQPPAPFAAGSTHVARLTFLDRTVNWTFVVGSLPAAKFFIEAEDFNYDSGKSKAEASAMPYFGGAYAGLGAVVGVDYSRGGSEPSSPLYRIGEAEQIPMDRTSDRDRNISEVQVNFKIGWAGAPQWYNYTRDFPAGTYNVYAAISCDSTGAHDCRATLQQVGDATTANQTLTELGAFDAPGTHDVGGWGANALVPLKDSTGSLVALPLGGTTTLRCSLGNGDWDYMLFTTPAAELPKFTAWRINTDGTMTLEWTGGGTLQAAPTVLGQWQDVTGATSPYTFQPSGNMLFGRIMR
jgi:hypothetical protein